MVIRATKFRKVLNAAVGGNANYIFLGDLNSMGLDYPYKKDIEASTELKRWDVRASVYYDMRRLPKTFDLTTFTLLRISNSRNSIARMGQKLK